MFVVYEEENLYLKKRINYEINGRIIFGSFIIVIIME